MKMKKLKEINGRLPGTLHYKAPKISDFVQKMDYLSDQFGCSRPSLLKAVDPSNPNRVRDFDIRVRKGEVTEEEIETIAEALGFPTVKHMMDFKRYTPTIQRPTFDLLGAPKSLGLHLNSVITAHTYPMSRKQFAPLWFNTYSATSNHPVNKMKAVFEGETPVTLDELHQLRMLTGIPLSVLLGAEVYWRATNLGEVFAHGGHIIYSVKDEESLLAEVQGTVPVAIAEIPELFTPEDGESVLSWFKRNADAALLEADILGFDEKNIGFL